MARQLTLLEQLDVLSNTVTQGDFDLFVRAMKDPHLITPEENRTVAQSLGLSNGFVSWVVNVATDPFVWIGLLLAFKNPVALYNRGIPKRFVGTALEFGGMGKLFKPVANVFRGTGIDGRIVLGMYRDSYIKRLASPVAEALSALNPAEKAAIIRFREEGITSGMTKLAHNVSEMMTKFFEQVWGKMATVADVRGSVASGFISYGGFTNRATGALIEAPRLPRSFMSLIPHIPILTTEETITLSGSEALMRMARRGGKKLEQALKQEGFPAVRYAQVRGADGEKLERTVVQLGPWKINAADQIETGTADFQRFMRSEGGKVFFGHLEPRVRPGPLSEFDAGTFVMDLDQIFQSYVRGASRTYAWNSTLTKEESRLLGGQLGKLVENPNPVIKGKDGRFLDAFISEPASNEPLIVQIQKLGLESMGIKMEQTVVRGTENFNVPVRGIRFAAPGEKVVLKMQALDHLIASLKGSSSDKQIYFKNAFSTIVGALEKSLGTISPTMQKQLATTFEYLQTNGTDRAVNNFLATWSYYTTLGLNASPTLGNALQTFLTTLPTVGLGPTIEGIIEFTGRLPRYTKEIVRQFRDKPNIRALPQYARNAFGRTFPELAEAKIDLDPRLLEIDADSLVGGTSLHLQEKFKTVESYVNWVMLPFRAVETANRAVAFFATKAAGRQMMRLDSSFMSREVMEAGDVAIDQFLNLHSARTVNATQFLSGGGTRTIAQDHVAPWLRVLTSFPIRFFSWAGESTVRGALTEAEMRTAGMLTRITKGRNFGTLARLYVSGAVMKSGFRDVLGLDVNRWVGFGPTDPSGDLGPLPIPVIPGALITIGKAIVNREWDRTQLMDVPGLGKLPIPKTLVPAGVAFSRLAKAIDQFEPDMGGFVDEDNRLMRRAGVLDQIMAMLGIPTSKARRERIQLTQLRVRIGRIKEMRRKFAMSMLNGDIGAAARLRREHSKMFPDMPVLQVDEEDLNTYYVSSRIPRLARAMKGLGAQRPLMERQIIDIDPAMIAPAPAGIEQELSILEAP